MQNKNNTKKTHEQFSVPTDRAERKRAVRLSVSSAVRGFSRRCATLLFGLSERPELFDFAVPILNIAQIGLLAGQKGNVLQDR